MTRRLARSVEAVFRSSLASALPFLATFLQAGGWERMADLPEPNGGMIGYAVGEDIIVAGGTNWENGAKRWLARRWRFDASLGAWQPLPPLPAPLAYAAAAGIPGADAVLTAGGSDSGSSIDSILEWRGENPPGMLGHLPLPVTLAAAAFSDGRFFVIGGAADIADFGTVTAQSFERRAGSGEARRLPDYPAGPTAMAAVAATKTRVFAFAGAAWDAPGKQVINRSAAFVFDPAASRWDPIRPYPFAARGVAAIALDEQHVFLAGGFRNGREDFTDETFVYDIASDRYDPCVRLPIRALAHLVRTREWLWVLGGEDRQRHRSAACWRIRVGVQGVMVDGGPRRFRAGQSGQMGLREAAGPAR